jgi:hypothetical protein
MKMPTKSENKLPKKLLTKLRKKNNFFNNKKS